MANLIVVTGASGNVGRVVAERVLAGGAKARVVARKAEKLEPLVAQGAEPRVGSLGDSAFVKEAFQGASAAFVMVPPDYAAADPIESQRTVIDALTAAVRDSGLTHAVVLSSVGADLASGNGPIRTLHTLEQRLGAIAGLNAVFLRAAYFMENHMNSIGLIKSAGINGGAQKGDVPMPMIATRDIAAVAAELLVNPSFSGKTVRYLLGPKDYTQAEATRVLGAAIGKPDLQYVAFPYDDARKGMVGSGLSPALADLFVEMADAFNTGRIAVAPRAVASTTPTTIEEFARTVFAPAFGA